MKSKVLHIHIDRLVVEGLHSGQQRQFLRALEAELGSQLPQLAGPAFAAGGTSRRILRVNAGEIRKSSTPDRAASQIVSTLRQTIAGKGNARA